jgi:hypothetical protein
MVRKKNDQPVNLAIKNGGTNRKKQIITHRVTISHPVSNKQNIRPIAQPDVSSGGISLINFHFFNPTAKTPV